MAKKTSPMTTNPHITHQRGINTLRELVAQLAPAAQSGEHSMDRAS